MRTVISLLLLIAVIINSGPCCVYSLKAKANKGKYEEETTIFNDDTTLVNDNININISTNATTVPDATTAVVEDDSVVEVDDDVSVEFGVVGGDDDLTAMPSENNTDSIAPSTTLVVETATPSMDPSAPLLSTNLPSVEPTPVPSSEWSESLQPSVRNSLSPAPSLRNNATATAVPTAIISTRVPSAAPSIVINSGMNSTESPSFQPVMEYPTQLEVVEEGQTSIPSSQPSNVLKEKDLSPSAVSNNTATTEPPVRVRNGTAVKVEDQSNTGLLGALLSVSLFVMIGVGIVAFQKYSSKKKKEATPPPPTRTDHVIYRPSDEEKKRVKAKEERRKIRHKLALEALESRKNGHRMSDASRQRLVEELAKSPAMEIRGYINPMSA